MAWRPPSASFAGTAPGRSIPGAACPQASKSSPRRQNEGHGGPRRNTNQPRPAAPACQRAAGSPDSARAGPSSPQRHGPAHAACPAIPPFSVALRGPLPLLRVENWPAGLARSEPIARAGTPTLTILAATRAQDRDQAPDDWLDGCGDCDAGRSKTRHYQRHRALDHRSDFVASDS